MNPSRRQLLGTMAAAGVASLFHPGPVLTDVVAQQPCTTGGDPGTLVGTLPLFRSGGQEHLSV
jgi:hypothetical protein